MLSEKLLCEVDGNENKDPQLDNGKRIKTLEHSILNGVSSLKPSDLEKKENTIGIRGCEWFPDRMECMYTFMYVHRVWIYSDIVLKICIGLGQTKIPDPISYSSQETTCNLYHLSKEKSIFSKGVMLYIPIIP